jgi:hypothetical protein
MFTKHLLFPLSYSGNWSPAGESNTASSVYKTAASPAMLAGQLERGRAETECRSMDGPIDNHPKDWCSADDSNVASRPYQGLASPSMLAERCLVSPSGVEPPLSAFGGRMPLSLGGDELVPQAGVEPAKPAFVARAPCPSAGMKGVGACRRLVASIEQAGRGFSPLQSPAPQPPVPRPVYLNSSPKMVPHPGIYPGRCS